MVAYKEVEPPNLPIPRSGIGIGRHRFRIGAVVPRVEVVSNLFKDGCGMFWLNFEMLGFVGRIHVGAFHSPQ